MKKVKWSASYVKENRIKSTLTRRV